MSKYILIAMIVIQAMIQAAKMHTVTIYEDGSFGIGYLPYAFHGCTPYSPCGKPELIIHDDRMNIMFSTSFFMADGYQLSTCNNIICLDIE